MISRVQGPVATIWLIPVFATVAIAFCWTGLATGLVQKSDGDQVTSPEDAPTLKKTPKQVWEIGIKVDAIEHSTGIRVFFPVPVDWTDQSVSILAQDASPNVARARLGDEEEHVRWMTMEVPQLAAGDSASVIVKLELEKSDVIAPADPSTLVFAKDLPKDVKKWTLPSPQIESRNKKIRELADSIEIDESLPAWNQVETIYVWVRDNIEYRFETKNRSCLEALETRYGDCGEMTGLFIAICRARGIPARAVWIPEHTYPEFYLEDAAGNGHWFPCQAAGSRLFGEMREPRIILQKGDRFRVPGNREELRYLQPTLQATSGGATVEFIHRPTETK